MMCETSVLQHIQQRQHENIPDLHAAELKDFEKSKPEWLRGFIHCHLFDTPDRHVKANYKYPNKGRLKNCIDHQQDCLLQRAYNLKDTVVKFKIPQRKIKVCYCMMMRCPLGKNGEMKKKRFLLNKIKKQKK